MAIPAFSAMAQSSGPAKGVPDTSSATGGWVVTQGGEGVLFEQASQASSPDMDDIRSFAAPTLPTLRQHLQMVQSLAGSCVPTAKQ